MNILIVDDELVSREKLEKIMDRLGDCEAAENGEDALRIAMSANPPDLILLDIMMPGMDGFEVCERLKADPQTKDIPVIFLSGLDDKGDIIRGLEVGAVDYIAKPFHKAEVKARVSTHLSLKEKTEQLRQRDLQLLEMDRIVGIGTLAAGIAHEINTPLSIVKSSVGLLQKCIGKMTDAIHYWDDKPLPEALLTAYNDYLSGMNLEQLTASLDARYDRITRGIERIMKIVSSLKSFSRVDMEATGKIDLNRSMEDAVDVLSTQDDKEVEFVKEFKDVPLLECYPREINQGLLHVLKNALDAIDHKGTITLTTLYREEDDQIVIGISDDGKGMSPEVVKQVFNPFFTTKAVGSGTGVGLSMTERIIRRHGGKIDISSKEGEGTTVTIAFPVGREVSTEQQ